MDAYAGTRKWWRGSQSAYDAGLTWFPDDVIAPEPLGLVPAVLTVGGEVLQNLTGGAQRDAARQRRVNYVLAAAQQGNVNAARLILGAPANVSGNERTMWERARAQLMQTSTGAATLASAQAAGPYWPVGSGESIDTFDVTRAFVDQWHAAHHPVQAASDAVQGALAAHGGGMGTVALVGAAALAVWLMRKRK